MAVITKKVVAPVKVAAKVAAPVKTVAKVAPKVEANYEAYDMSDIVLVPKGGGGGGRALSPLANAAFSLEIGQGIKISDKLYNGGKGVASLYAGAKRRNIKLRTRRDNQGNMWLFRIEMPEVEEVVEE
jgi:hypothetical protein